MAAEAATPAEPEVIKKGKKEEEGEEGEKGAAEAKPEKGQGKEIRGALRVRGIRRAVNFASGASDMRLIVGLGNPGIEYAWTPHNLGFLAIDRLAEMGGIRVERPEAKSVIGRGEIGGQEVVLAKPQTMMNLSGFAVRDLLGRLEIGPADLIVLCDEVQLPWGMIRVRPEGTAGTHNGMKSVVASIASTDFCRVRLGVGPDHR